MWNCQQLIGMTVAAGDGELGRLSDLCFDQEQWVIKYFVVDAPSSESKVLIALAGEDEERTARAAELACGVPDWAGVSRSSGASVAGQLARDGAGLVPTPGAAFVAVAGFAATTASMGSCLLLDEKVPADGAVPAPFLGRLAPQRLATGEAPGEGLRRVEEVRGYRVVAKDSDIGQVEGFLINEGSWSIEYVVVRVRDADSVKRVVVVPSWIESIDPESCRVLVEVNRDVIVSGPEFTEDVQEGYENWLFGSLGRLITGEIH